LVSSNQDKKLIISSKKFVLLFLIENYLGDQSVKVKAYLEGCTKEYKIQLEELLQEYIEVFQDLKGLPPKREVEHDIHLFPNFPVRVLTSLTPQVDRIICFSM
jgi:hypothetical protein